MNDLIPRDRWGRPLVVHPLGGRPVPYTRCTTYVSALEDTYNLEKWKMRMTALGLSARPDLVLSTVAHKDDKDVLNKICDQAVEAAKANAAATTGTALHTLTEQHDRGELDLGTVPVAYRPDIAAYSEATKCLTVRQIEQFGVIDTLKVAGTWDRVVTYDGVDYIADLKTGSIEYGMGKIAMQLAVYSRCETYDPVTHERAWPMVNRDKAIVIHLPAGTGKCILRWVDIASGWAAVALAGQVRAWRARKDLDRAFEYAKVEVPTPTPDTDPLLALIHQCIEVVDLRALWAANQQAWKPIHTAAASARQNTITHLTGRTH